MAHAGGSVDPDRVGTLASTLDESMPSGNPAPDPPLLGRDTLTHFRLDVGRRVEPRVETADEECATNVRFPRRVRAGVPVFGDALMR